MTEMREPLKRHPHGRPCWRPACCAPRAAFQAASASRHLHGLMHILHQWLQCGKACTEGLLKHNGYLEGELWLGGSE